MNDPAHSSHAGSAAAERLLWQHLCARQIDGCEFRRHQRFANYTLGFACLERMVVVELQADRQMERTHERALRSVFLQRAGFQILTFGKGRVVEDTSGVLEEIWKALRARARAKAHAGSLVGRGAGLMGSG